MAKLLLVGLRGGLVSPRSHPWLPSFTRPLFRYHSQSEMSLDNYIKREQTDMTAKFLTSSVYPLYIRMYKKDLAAAASKKDPGRRYVNATPLLDVLHVSVHTNQPDDCERKERPPLEIHGTIQLIDDLNNTYHVYHREPNNPETVSHGANLSLTCLDGTLGSLFLPCVSALKMRVHLRDAAAEGKYIAKGDFDVQLMDKTCYNDKVVTQVVDGHGAGAFASIQYATLPYAVIADVELSLTKNDQTDSDRSHALIYGTVSASCKVKDGSISSVLFNRAPSEPIMVDLAAPIKLSRDMLAVPAYSSIQIKTDLWDHRTNQQIASDVIVANVDAGHEDWARQEVDLGQNYHIKAIVSWSHAYQYVFTGSGGTFDDQKFLCGQISSLTSYGFASPFELRKYYRYYCYFGLYLFEVFSISISLHNDATSRICGTIKVYDAKNYGEKSYCIFEKSNSSPEILDGDMKIKSLKWPTSPFEGNDVGMLLHLTDDAGHEVCKGYLDWNVLSTTGPISWYDKRVSSVIQGQHGYATVHYALFDKAIMANVKVVFIPNRSFDGLFKIFGNILARYSNFIYSTYSEKMFFQSTLFEDNHHTIVAGGSPLVLQKSVVPLPYGSSLIVDVKLHAQAMHESSQGMRLEHFGSLDKVVDFDVTDETCIRRIEGEDFLVDVFVEWIGD